MVLILGVVIFNIYLVLSGSTSISSAFTVDSRELELTLNHARSVLEASQRTSTAGKLRDRIYPEPTTPTPSQIHAILTCKSCRRSQGISEKPDGSDLDLLG